MCHVLIPFALLPLPQVFTNRSLHSWWHALRIAFGIIVLVLLLISGAQAVGNVWIWGENQYYQLGDGTTNNRYNPVQVMMPDETLLLA